MMVNAAPRLATILCLDPSQSRLFLCFSDTSRPVPLVRKLHPTARVSKFSEAHEKRLTLAMPMGEAASDIAGAMLKLAQLC